VDKELAVIKAQLTTSSAASELTSGSSPAATPAKD
jgi:hypothetical protein